MYASIYSSIHRSILQSPSSLPSLPFLPLSIPPFLYSISPAFSPFLLSLSPSLSLISKLEFFFFFLVNLNYFSLRGIFFVGSEVEFWG